MLLSILTVCLVFLSKTSQKITPNESTPKKKPEVEQKHMWELCKNTEMQVDGTIGDAVKDDLGSKSLIFIQKGNMPILLSVPHGASSRESTMKWQNKHLAPRVPLPKSSNNEESNFQQRLQRVDSDTFTVELAMEISKQISTFDRTLTPYIVMARFSRKFIDVNRRMNMTMDCCPNLWPKCTAVADVYYGKSKSKEADIIARTRTMYKHYHYRIRDVFNEMVRSGVVTDGMLFLDIHAQRAKDLDEEWTANKFKTAVIAGTQDGRGLPRTQSYTQQDGILLLLSRLLRKKRFSLYPPNDSVPDHPRYNGGHLVAIAGNANTHDIVDAVQLEFGSELRMSKAKRLSVAKQIALSILCSKYVQTTAKLKC